MRCKYCGVEVDDNVLVCPLCHEKLDGYDSEKLALYPPKDKAAKKKRSHVSFTRLYWGIAIGVFFAALGIDLGLTPNVQWFWLVGLVAVYAYLLVQNTILSNSSIAVKVLLQCLLVVGLLFSFAAIFEQWDPKSQPSYYVTQYAMPLTLCISNIVMVIFTWIWARRHPVILVDCIFLLLLGFLPIILYACRVIEILWPSLIVAVFSAISILLCFALGHRAIKEEAQKKFHM